MLIASIFLLSVVFIFFVTRLAVSHANRDTNSYFTGSVLVSIVGALVWILSLIFLKA